MKKLTVKSKKREKIAVMQAILKQIDGQWTEQENLQIIQQVRALKLSRNELYAFINGGELPPVLAGAIVGADEPEAERYPGAANRAAMSRTPRRRLERWTATPKHNILKARA